MRRERDMKGELEETGETKMMKMACARTRLRRKREAKRPKAARAVDLWPGDAVLDLGRLWSGGVDKETRKRQGSSMGTGWLLMGMLERSQETERTATSKEPNIL